MAKKRAGNKEKTIRRSAAPKKSVAAKTAKTPSRNGQVRRRVEKAPAGANGSRVAVSRGSLADVSAPTAPRESSGLSKKDLAELREQLLTKRAQLIGDVNNLHNEALRSNRQDASGDLSSMPIHMADIGTDNYEQEFTLGLIEGERAILREIDEALKRMEDGSYGLCVATGKPIGRARLKASPWAKYCYEYKLEQEKGMNRRF